MSSNYYRYRNDDYEDSEEDNEEFRESGNEDDEEEEQILSGEYRGRQKKQRLDNSVSNYEFAPRARVTVPNSAYSNLHSSSVAWSDQETIVLLDVWGDRFLQLGKESLRSEDWLEVAEKVSDATKVHRSDTHCRNRLDILKKKYGKEKAKLEGMDGEYVSRWAFFQKMDTLLNSSMSRQQCGLACGFDSGEFVFMNPNVYVNRSNGLDEMMDSPGESEDEGDEKSESFQLLADSVLKFQEIYEKIECSKRQQMLELEKMRVDFQRDLELQKKQILDKAEMEIAKIRQGVDGEDTDVSAENFSG